MRYSATHVLCAIGLGLLPAGTVLAQAAPDPYSQPVTCNANTFVDPAALSPLMPCDAPTSQKMNPALPATMTPALIQESFDTFSWQSFVALNWPADGTAIGKGKDPGGDAPAVWQGWMDAFALMTANPPAWGSAPPLPAACKGLPAGTLLSMVGKTPDLLTASTQPFDSGPLIDQNGRYTRFQILVNKPMYDFIVGNRLTTKEGQAAYKPTVTPPNSTIPTMTFPGSFQTGPVTSGTPVATAPGYDGAVMLKLAYKVMGPTDDPARFHTLKALVYTAGATPEQDSCVAETVGLVGLHVGNKVQRFPQWVWSTFEHARNAPEQAQVDAGTAKGPYNYYNAACTAKDCPPNQPPPRPWNPAVQPFPGGYKTQVTRVIALADAYKAINAKWQAPLAGTVWANYELIGTQWPTQPDNQASPTGYPFPLFLANTTMETYTQGTVPQSSSTCIGCHNNAVDTAGRPSDFTYILSLAAKKIFPAAHAP